LLTTQAKAFLEERKASMKPVLPYRSRSEAGRLLTAELGTYKSAADVLVLGLARGGLLVAAELASALDVPLDVLVVRKLGTPIQPELAIGVHQTARGLGLRRVFAIRLFPPIPSISSRSGRRPK
jgi:hypothetical protein